MIRRKLMLTNRPGAITGPANMANLDMVPAAHHQIPATARASSIMMVSLSNHQKLAGNEVIAFPLFPRLTTITSTKNWCSYKAMGKR